MNCWWPLLHNDDYPPSVRAPCDERGVAVTSRTVHLHTTVSLRTTGHTTTSRPSYAVTMWYTPLRYVIVVGHSMDGGWRRGLASVRIGIILILAAPGMYRIQNIFSWASQIFLALCKIFILCRFETHSVFMNTVVWTIHSYIHRFILFVNYFLWNLFDFLRQAWV